MRRRVALRLAEHVAHTVDVDAMLDSMSNEQFTEWCAKDRIEPIGAEATRHVLAMIGVTVASFAGAKGVTINTFMPWVADPEAKPQTEKQMQAVMSNIPGVITHGGTR